MKKSLLNSEEEYNCPHCTTNLLLQENGYHCPKCSEKFIVNNGIIDLSVTGKKYYFNPIPRKDFQKLLSEMDSCTWFDTLDNFLKRVDYKDDWVANLTDETRNCWKYLLPLNKNDKVLDLGCGLGSVSESLMPHVNQIYAMDLTYERVAFTRKRLDRLGVASQHRFLLGGDGAYLPFRSSFFDHVILYGVLEWVSDINVFSDNDSKIIKVYKIIKNSFGKTSARIIQLNLLKEIYRILKPNGCLFIAIENRYGYQYLNNPDNHSRLMYASLMPRIFSKILSVYKNKKDYRTYTYSYHGYKSILKQASFKEQVINSLFPSYHKIQEITELSANSNCWKPEKKSIRDRIKRSSVITPCFGIVTSKGQKPASLMERILDSINADLTKQGENAGKLYIKKWMVSKKQKLILTIGNNQKDYIVKVPLCKEARLKESINYNTLSSIRDYQELQQIAPKVYLEGELNNCHYFVEEKILGKTWQDLYHERSSGLSPHIMMNVITKLSSCNHKKIYLVGKDYETHVGKHLDEICKAIYPIEDRDRIKAYFEDVLYGTEYIQGIQKGDFSVSNTLMKDNEVSGLIDWDMSELDGIPMLDWINFYDSRSRLKFNKKLTTNVLEIINGKIPKIELNMFEKMLIVNGIENHKLGVFALLYLLQHVSTQISYGKYFNVRNTQRNIFEFIEVMKKLMSERRIIAQHMK